MSIFDEFLGKITSCFGGRQDDSNPPRSIVDKTQKIKNRGDFEEDDMSHLSCKENSVYNTTDNNYLYSFKYICEVLTTIGINLYKVKTDYFLLKSAKKIVPVNLKFDPKNSAFLFSNISRKDSENIFESRINQKITKVKLKNVSEFIHGNLTSNFKLLNSKLEITPWRCFSLFTKNYETLDFICEKDEDLAIILIFLELQIQNDLQNLVEIIDEDYKSKINSIMSKIYWKRAYMKIKFNSSN